MTINFKAISALPIFNIENLNFSLRFPRHVRSFYLSETTENTIT